MGQIIDGKAESAKIKQELAKQVAIFKEATGVTPGLATILVGENQASQVYIRNKIKSCEQVGMISHHFDMPNSTSESDLLKKIKELNQDATVHGILVQLPLPNGISEQRILDAIDPKKDVDGFHPFNVGKLVVGREGLRPCTPHGIMKLLESIDYSLTGKHAVVVGRSNIVGKPIALMLLAAHATVTICHSKTADLAQEVKRADLVIAAVGRAKFIPGDWLKQGAVVIDVGINRNDAGKLCGDVDFESAQNVAQAITPVPGGVGPMTIAMLLVNTLTAAKDQVKET